MTASTTIEYHNLRGHGSAVEQIRDHRRVEVERMMLARTPIRVMADRLRVSTRTVQKDIKVIERYWRESSAKDRSKRIERESRVLDLLEKHWLQRATWDEGAVDVVLRVQARRAKLLGLDAPTQSSVEITAGGGDELRKRAQELVDNELQRRRELRERAALNGGGDVIDIESTG